MHRSYSVFSDLFEQDVMNIRDYETSVNQYNTTGGAGLESVNRQIQELTEWLDKMQTLKCLLHRKCFIMFFMQQC